MRTTVLALVTTALGVQLATTASAATWRGRQSAAGRLPAAAAQEFARDHKSDLRLARDDDALPTAVHKAPSGRYVRLGRYRSGLRIDGGEVVVHLTPDGDIDLARTRDLAPFHGSVVPAVSHAAAEAIARAASGLGSRARNQIAELLLYAADKQPRLAWNLWLFADRPAARWRVVVDAQSGAVLFASDMIKRVTGSGDVFDPSPVVVLQDNSLTDQGNANAAVPGGAYSTVSLLGLDPADGGGFFHLTGTYVKSTDLEDPTIAPPAENTSTFSYLRADDNFEWVMAYYHIDGVERFIQGLGFSTINNRQIEVDAHGVDGEDNSHYSPDGVGTGYLALGDGGVDDAEDGEVIVHEFGHSAQDNQCPNCFDGPEGGAMGEGFGDFLAASYYLNVSAGYQDACVFDWDSTSTSTDSPPCGRRLDGTKHYPEDVDGEVHDDGEIWSGALWDILLAVSGGPTPTLAARDAVLSIVLESHFLVPPLPTFYEAAQALIDAEQNLYGGAYHAPLVAVLQARGLLSLCGTAPEPSAGCFQQFEPLKAALSVTDKATDTKDKLSWSWKKGVATTLGDLGDPVNGSPRYELCVYDSSANAQPLSDAVVVGGGTCKGKPCWKATGATGSTPGYKFSNSKGIGSHGITSLALKSGVDGKSQVTVSGKGDGLYPPDPALTLPVTVQLLVKDGTMRCWQTQFTTADKNEDEKFKAKGP